MMNNKRGTLWVKDFGQSSTAGNVGRTGSAKTNQDSIFVSQMGSEGRVGVKDAIKIGPQKIDWFVAVADGHGANGHHVSQFIAEHMPRCFEQEKKKAEKQKIGKEMPQKT